MACDDDDEDDDDGDDDDDDDYDDEKMSTMTMMWNTLTEHALEQNNTDLHNKRMKWNH